MTSTGTKAYMAKQQGMKQSTNNMENVENATVGQDKPTMEQLAKPTPSLDEVALEAKVESVLGDLSCMFVADEACKQLDQRTTRATSSTS